MRKECGLGSELGREGETMYGSSNLSKVVCEGVMGSEESDKSSNRRVWD